MASALEDVRFFSDTAIVILLYFERAFDTPPGHVVRACLRHVDSSGSMMRYIEVLLLDRTYSVQRDSVTGGSHKLSRGVPQGSCRNPALLIISLAMLPLCMARSLHPSAMIVCADDIFFWASHSNRPIILRVVDMFRHLGKSVFVSKTNVLTCSKRPVRHGYP